MATPVIMPRQGQSVESCIITKWHKKKGDKVSQGDILFSYETDKASFDEEAPVSGEMLDVYFEEGDDVECLLNVCVIGEPGEDTSAFAPKKEGQGEEQPAEQPAQQAAEAPTAQPVAVKSEPADGFIKISPRAKGLASRQGIDYKYAEPTGPNGRIIERDIRALAESGVKFTSAAAGEYEKNPGVSGTGIGGRVSLSDFASAPAASAAPVQPAAEYTDEKVPNIRKVIAKTMHASLSDMAQLTLNTSFDATAIMNFRALVKENRESLGLENITLNDIVLYAVSRTLPEFRALNANWLGDTIRYFNVVNLGVAVDTPRGLLVPTVYAADRLSLNELSKQSKAVISDAQSGTINPDLLKGASFTVTNLGSLGVTSFTPVINPPQTGILGVCGIETKVKVVNGELKAYKAMNLSLTFDHRALDGAPAAKFLQKLAKNLENFTLMLAK